MTTLSFRQTCVLVAIFVVTSGTFIGLDSQRALDPVKEGVHGLIDPVTAGFQRVADMPGGSSDLEAELAAVTAERDRLRAEAIRVQDVENTNDQLRQQLGIEDQYPDYRLLSAGVVNLDPTNNQKFLVIDKGSDDGVREGMAVVDPNYYVGQVTEVEATSARVTLLIDFSQAVGARLLDGGDGVLYGMWQEGGRAELRAVPTDAAPKPGDEVLTAESGAAQSVGIPGRLPIGRVGENIVRDEQSDTLIVPVVPYCQFDDLKVVTVILGPTSGDETPPAEAGAPAAPANPTGG